MRGLCPMAVERNSMRFSIIDDEWPEIKQHLAQKLLSFSARVNPS